MFDDDDLSGPLRPQNPRPAARDETDVAEPPEPAPRVADETKQRPRLLAGRRGKTLRYASLILLGLIVLYYPIGMLIVHRVNDELDFQPPAAWQVDGGSRAVEMTVGLIDREVNHTDWVANSPFLYPSAALDNMPNFQLGLKSALFRFAIELTDQIGRTRGSSQADPDLDAAAGELKFPGDVWVWDPKISLLPTATSEDHYRRAITLLDQYNRRLADGQAVFDRRADNLLGTLDRFAADLGSASAELDQHIALYSGGWSGGLLDLTADNLFFNVKGRLYGYAMILEALGADFREVIAERQIDALWDQMLGSLAAAAALDPLLIVNGGPDGMTPSHLAAQGFYLLRARTQLREITNALLK